MYAVTVSIRENLLRATDCLDSAGLIDILWAHALPEDRLEHIAKHISDDTVDIKLFVKSDTPENAYQTAIRICHSALHASSALAGEIGTLVAAVPHGRAGPHPAAARPGRGAPAHAALRQSPRSRIAGF